jgi:hypothetical protein
MSQAQVIEDQDDDQPRSAESSPFAREEELRRQSASEPLGGCDVEHCQRMHE